MVIKRDTDNSNHKKSIKYKHLKTVRIPIDRRQYLYTVHLPERRNKKRRSVEIERRSGNERRSGYDRRTVCSKTDSNDK